MKYYIYVSEAKVDMIFSQIPKRARDRIATELKFDLKIFSTIFKEGEAKDTLYSKLKVVIDYIEKNYDVGTIDNPKEYFKGNLPMRWGPFPPNEMPASVVYFAGQTDSTVLGLGGSLKHVIGSQGDWSQSTPNSFTPYLLSVLEKELDLTEMEKYGENWRIAEIFSNAKNRDEEALSVVSNTSWMLKGPEQQLEFLARKLLDGPSGNERVVLGTPIYVALANERA
jgi:hypothetical protein